ncbi:MAG TPA: GspH/FimT family pseudopilin [Tahibacter sp.]|jgi:type IV fimbrial biogenesis protein FimT|nr:GspH/FimT family pseudopilin [Tahibacter sp.]
MLATRLTYVSRGPRPAQGFSLIEMITVLAIAAILVGIALPNFREFNRRSNVTEINNSLVTAINLARAEAVKRGRSVAVVSTSGGSDWSTGWSVIVDDNNNGSFTDASDSKLQARATVDVNNYKVTTKATGSGGADKQLTFGIAGTMGLGTKFDINVCRNGEPAKSKHIVITASGMTSSYSDVAGSPAPTC